MTNTRALVFYLVAFATVSSAARAAEFGNSHADLGYVDTLVGISPPPGFYFRDDVEVITSNRLNDRNGNKVNLDLTAIGAGRYGVKFRNTVEEDIFSFAYVPDYKIPYINATIGASAYAAVVNARAGVTTRIGIPEAAANDKAGYSDTTFVPIFFGFDIKGTSLHVILAPFDFTAPTGRYSRSDPIGNNIGNNYWSYRPALEVTYLNKTGQQLDLNLGSSFNSQNPATHYKTGNEIYFTYAAQQYLTPKFSFGVTGYYLKQISNDTVNGQVVNSSPATLDALNAGPGNVGETFAIGPVLSYNPKPYLFLQAHWDHELFAYNRYQREQVYFRGIVHF